MLLPVSKPFVKKQQTRWTEAGAHLSLQVRTLKKMPEADRGTALLVDVMLGGDLNVTVPQRTACCVNPMGVINPGAEFFAQRVQRVCAANALSSALSIF